ncbi:MAG TPA: Druantia anti-phage system protein DruA, partial [Verrucomicrobiae bacterium]|nr:Druantia anti-phage system protein DruA [Verrucomicrobiae bacterium]
MKSKHRPILTTEEQAVLDGVQVRLVVARPERERFDRLLIEGHYLHSAEFVGEQLRYVAEYEGQWVALLVWSAGAYKLKLREEWIGWSDRQKRRRLPLVVNNSRLFIPKPCHIPNLASKVMKLNLQWLSSDWEQVYHHAVLIAETFVDPEQFRGTTYQASGWTLLGKTKGFQRSRQDFYEAHDRPKQLWVRELREGARTVLRGRNL